jgi:hypothetical protein
MEMLADIRRRGLEQRFSGWSMGPESEAEVDLLL